MSRTGPAWRRLERKRAALVGLSVLAAWGLLGELAPFICSDRPVFARWEGRTYWFPNAREQLLRDETNLSLRAKLVPERGDWMLEPLVPFGPNQTLATGQPNRGPPPWAPDGEHWFGTDNVGRDVLARIVYGSRVSLWVGLASVLVALAIGVALGTLAGYLRGWLDAVVLRLVEFAQSFPTLLFVLALMGVLGSIRQEGGPPGHVLGTWPIVLVIGCTRWVDVARLVRAEVLRITALEYVQASRALGASAVGTLMRHVVPNALGPVWVAAPLGVASAILVESALSYLGFGVAPPTASWGGLLTDAHASLLYPGAWWLALFPGLALFLTVGALNLVAEGLRDERGN